MQSFCKSKCKYNKKILNKKHIIKTVVKVLTFVQNKQYKNIKKIHTLVHSHNGHRLQNQK